MDTANSYLEAQSKIDLERSELAALTQETTRLLHSRRNALAPAFKLPDDILLDIFLLIRDSSDRRVKNWYQIMQICEHWRQVAVTAPSLWTSLYEPPHALTPLMLERSQTAPLHVHFTSFSTKHSTATLISVLHQIERIQTLTLERVPFDFMATVHDALTGLGSDWKASLLESLSVGIDPQPRPGPVKLAMNVFRPTGLLRNLFLTGGYDWNMLPLPSLTELGLYGEALGKLSGAQFIETLRQMQNLEVLGIEWESMNLFQYPPTPHPQPVHLPHLRKLEVVNGHQTHIESFLSLVTHPNLRQLSVGSSSPVNDVVPFIQSVLPSIRNGRVSPLEFLRIEFEYVTMSAKNWLSHSDGPYIHMFIPVDGEHFDRDDEGRGFEFIVNIISCITSFDCPDKILLRHLTLDCDWDASMEEFWYLFSSLPHLETIEVHHKVALLLLKALNIAITSRSATPNALVPFPKLQSITWTGEHQYNHTVPMIAAEVFYDLFGSLLSRRVYGVPITKLELIACGRLDDVQVKKLEEIGVEIIARR